MEKDCQEQKEVGQVEKRRIHNLICLRQVMIIKWIKEEGNLILNYEAADPYYLMMLEQ